MGPFKKVFGLWLATLPDIGSGIIAVRFIGWLYDTEISWSYYAAGIFFALLPDLDMLFPLAREFICGDDADSSHKALPTHYPLIMLPTIVFPLLFMNQSYFAFLAGVCLLVHYFHDSWQSGEKGPGVRWLAPFGKNYYQILSRRAKGERIRLFLVVSPEQVAQRFEETLEEWLNLIFFHPTWENAIGISIFLLAIASFWL